MKSKKCNKCEEVKTVDCFAKSKTKKDGLQNSCKECFKKYLKKYWQENREKLLERKKKHYQENREKLLEHQKKYRQENKEKVREKDKKYWQENREKILERKKKHYQENKEKIREHQKKYRQENREKLLERKKKHYQENREKLLEYYKKYQKNRYNTDPLFKLRNNVRTAIRRYLKNGKSKRTSEIIGCSFEQLLLNLGHPPEDAHLDHIVPQGLAINEDEIYTLNHWSNFQWLPAEENISKSSNFTYKENLDHVLKNHPEPAKIRAIIRRAQKDGYQIVKSDKLQSKEPILAGLY